MGFGGNVVPKAQGVGSAPRVSSGSSGEGGGAPAQETGQRSLGGMPASWRADYPGVFGSQARERGCHPAVEGLKKGSSQNDKQSTGHLPLGKVALDPGLTIQYIKKERITPV